MSWLWLRLRATSSTAGIITMASAAATCLEFADCLGFSSFRNIGLASCLSNAVRQTDDIHSLSDGESTTKEREEKQSKQESVTALCRRLTFFSTAEIAPRI